MRYFAMTIFPYYGIDYEQPTVRYKTELQFDYSVDHYEDVNEFIHTMEEALAQDRSKHP